MIKWKTQRLYRRVPFDSSAQRYLYNYDTRDSVYKDQHRRCTESHISCRHKASGPGSVRRCVPVRTL